MTTDRSGMSLEIAVAKIEAHDKYFSYAEADAWQIIKSHLSRDAVMSDDPENDERGNCNVCGGPLLYGERHSQCGAAVMRAEKAVRESFAARHASVPDEIDLTSAPAGWPNAESACYAAGWNACREAMLAQRDGG